MVYLSEMSSAQMFYLCETMRELPLHVLLKKRGDAGTRARSLAHFATA